LHIRVVDFSKKREPYFAHSCGGFFKNGNLILHIRVADFSKEKKGTLFFTFVWRIFQKKGLLGIGVMSCKRPRCHHQQLAEHPCSSTVNAIRHEWYACGFFIVNVCIASRVRSRSFDHASRRVSMML